MGHTLVTRFDSRSQDIFRTLMQPANANKIPFGRNCDRAEADSIMDYHLTLLHWAKTQDEYYLDAIKDFKPIPCQIWITGTEIMYAEEGSQLLYFTVSPTQDFLEMVDCLEQKTHTHCSRFLHITLAVSKDSREIEQIHRHIQQNIVFPFRLDIDGLDLYHIWKPTKKVRSL